MKLHVIFIGLHPGMTEFGVCPSKRLATIELTNEQVKALRPKWIGTQGGKPVWESIDQAFLEGNQIEDQPQGNPTTTETGCQTS